MKRVQLFEFEDFSWFPTSIRNSMTNLIVVLHKMMGISDVIAKLVGETLDELKTDSIIDLGSGSGGAMPMVHEAIIKDHPNASLTMTDLYPNPQAIKRFNSENSNLKYHEESVDATNFSSAPKGLKTMVNCFHHMRPEQARKIVQSAAENKEPLLIYEMAENNIPLIVWWLMLPISLTIVMLMCFFMTPFVRPMTWQQIVFTYLIPVIPITYAWDGQASLPRMYTMDDMDELLEGLETEHYTWKKGRALDAKGKKKGTYVIGMPK